MRFSLLTLFVMLAVVAVTLATFINPTAWTWFFVFNGTLILTVGLGVVAATNDGIRARRFIVAFALVAFAYVVASSNSDNRNLLATNWLLDYLYATLEDVGSTAVEATSPQNPVPTRMIVNTKTGEQIAVPKPVAIYTAPRPSIVPAGRIDYESFNGIGHCWLGLVLGLVAGLFVVMAGPNHKTKT